MNTKKGMTLNLTEAEMHVLDTLCQKKDLNKTALMRKALKLYELIEEKIERGGKIFIEDGKTKAKAEIMVL